MTLPRTDVQPERATTMWQADELLKKYPIESSGPPPIKGLISKVYHGSWKTRPDFSKLEPEATYEEHTGLISLANANKPENFGMVWEGELPVSRDGNYTFTLDSDDGSALYIDGKLVTEVKGLGGMGRAKSGKVKLSKGLHDIRVEYFELSGGEDISLAWQGPSIRRPQALSSSKPATVGGPKWPSIPIDPPKNGTAFYRGFIDGSTPRAIGVGYDGGINLAFSADHLGIELMWQERFYDGGRHWKGRGQGNEPPAGKNIIKLTSLPVWATLETSSAKWQPLNKGETKRRFRGYQLGENDRPTFNYDVGSLKISDTPSPNFDSKSLTRVITIDTPASGSPEDLHLLICNGLDIKPADSPNAYLLGKTMQVEIEANSSVPALVRNKELILPLPSQSREKPDHPPLPVEIKPSLIMRTLLLSLILVSPLLAAPSQEAFYLREEIPLPKGEVMEIGSIALMPDKKVAVTTRRGDLWICEGAYEEDLSKVKWTVAHRGLHEPLGMFYKDGSLILTQRPEVSKLTDTDKDGKIDSFETVCADWGINGDYHEYAFGSPADKDGNVWVVLCLTGSFNANSPWRGWCVRVTPDGEMIPTCSGIRSPGGIGFNAAGDTFYTDNQGVWNGSSSLKWLKPGSFQGNPTGNIFYPDQTAIEPLANEPNDGSRITTERKRIPKFMPPAVVLPHGKVGQSPTAIIHDHTAGKFGPFPNQVLVGEQTHSKCSVSSRKKSRESIKGRSSNASQVSAQESFPCVSVMTALFLWVAVTEAGPAEVASPSPLSACVGRVKPRLKFLRCVRSPTALN